MSRQCLKDARTIPTHISAYLPIGDRSTRQAALARRNDERGAPLSTNLAPSPIPVYSRETRAEFAMMHRQ
eukprot:12897431-Prorocentrum_lima.AAC.1